MPIKLNPVRELPYFMRSEELIGVAGSVGVTLAANASQVLGNGWIPILGAESVTLTGRLRGGAAALASIDLFAALQSMDDGGVELNGAGFPLLYNQQFTSNIANLGFILNINRQGDGFFALSNASVDVAPFAPFIQATFAWCFGAAHAIKLTMRNNELYTATSLILSYPNLVVR